MTFKFKVKFEDRTIQKAEVQELEDFDPILDGLKEKFGYGKKRRRS